MSSTIDRIQTCATMVTDEPTARQALTQLWAKAHSSGDTHSAWLVSVCMVLAINVEFVDFRGASQWCERFSAGWGDAEAQASCEAAIQGDPDGLRACAAALVWPSLDHAVSGDQPRFRAAALALARGLRQPVAIGPDERYLLVKCLLDYHGQQMDTQAANRLLATEHEQMAAAPPSVQAQARWWYTVMHHHAYFGEPQAAALALERLQALIQAHDLRRFRYLLLSVELLEWLKTGQMQRAERACRELEILMPEVRAGYLPYGLRAQARFMQHAGQHEAALQRIDRLMAICADLEVPERDQGTYRVDRAGALMALGRHQEALAELDGMRASQQGVQGELLGVIRGFTALAPAFASPDGPEAWADRPEQRHSLAALLADAKRLNFNRYYLMLPVWAGRLSQAALAAGIETEWVRAAIQERALPAPDSTQPDWPWRLRVRVLGPLTVERDGHPLRWTGKTPRKPLELLSLLAAHGGGPVAADWLISALWPSLEADAPKASLEMAVARLRKLLDWPEAVTVADGHVSLPTHLVWCDASAFEQRAERALALDERHPQRAAAIDAALALYGQPLLGTETLAGPLQLARERLALRWQALVQAAGLALEKTGDWPAALAWYQRALAADVLCEPTYRALMRTHLALNERAEAIRVYRRCRDLLASVLGIEPNAATRAMYDAALAPMAAAPGRTGLRDTQGTHPSDGTRGFKATS